MAKASRIVSADSAVADDRIDCGVIMPISETASHSEEHWRQVQTLLHRGILNAGFTPKNVWESSTNDRVSERIIGNIFRFPLAVADISDLNPNVMLELGLRLSSKRPTIVVVNQGGTIPFDIRDFHTLFYPPDMNMLGMEDFFIRLSKALREKHSAYASDNYTPFLNNVIVDVASPETRELGANELLLSRLDDLSERISRIDMTVRTRSRGQQSTRPPISTGSYQFSIPEDSFDDFTSKIEGWYEVDDIVKGSKDGNMIKGKIEFSGYDTVVTLFGRLKAEISKHGGEMEVPF